MASEQTVLTRAWRTLIIAGVVLGLLGIVYTFILNDARTDDIQTSLDTTQQSSCDGALAAVDQWTYAVDVLGELADRGRPGSSTTPVFLEFKAKTIARYEARAEAVCKLVE